MTFQLDDRKAFLGLRAVVSLQLLFMLLYDPSAEASLPLGSLAVLSLQVLSNLALAWAPPRAWGLRWLQPVVFLFDTLVVTMTILLARGWESDLYLVYFLVIYMAGMDTRLERSFLIGTVASACYMALLAGKTDSPGLLQPHVLLRFPLFYSTAFVSAFLAQRARRLSAQIEKGLRENSELRETYVRLEDAQARLVHTERLAAVGLLASGVAHELNNPLMSILGISQLLLQEDGLPAPLREDIEAVHSQTQRCRRITQGLMDFARRKPAEKSLLSVVSLIEAALQLARHDLSVSGIELALDLPPSLPPLPGDGAQLQQVFLGLITNARQALEGHPRGRLAISAREREGRVAVSIEDNGPGIPAAQLSRVFEPFFTTRPVGQGAGMGLSTARGIVLQHGGELLVESRAGAGTTFTVELPVEGGNHE